MREESEGVFLDKNSRTGGYDFETKSLISHLVGGLIEFHRIHCSKTERVEKVSNYEKLKIMNPQSKKYWSKTYKNYKSRELDRKLSFDVNHSV